jgi:hypothetical protein
VNEEDTVRLFVIPLTVRVKHAPVRAMFEAMLDMTAICARIWLAFFDLANVDWGHGSPAEQRKNGGGDFSSGGAG